MEDISIKDVEHGPDTYKMPVNPVAEEVRGNARVHYVNLIGFRVMDMMHEFGDNNCTLRYVPTDHRAELFEMPRYGISVYPNHPEHGYAVVVKDNDNLGLANRLTAELRAITKKPYILEERFED